MITTEKLTPILQNVFDTLSGLINDEIDMEPETKVPGEVVKAIAHLHSALSDSGMVAK